MGRRLRAPPHRGQSSGVSRAVWLRGSLGWKDPCPSKGSQEPLAATGVAGEPRSGDPSIGEVTVTLTAAPICAHPGR